MEEKEKNTANNLNMKNMQKQGMIESKNLEDQADKIFEHLRNELTYEANLIANRTSWFVASQAFFFTSLSAAIDRSPGVPFKLRNSLLFPLIPWISLCVCIVIFISVMAAICSTDKVRAKINEIKDTNPFASGFIPRSNMVIIAGLLPSFILPIIFAFSWILILCM